MPWIKDIGQFNVTTEWIKLPGELALSNNQYYFKNVQKKGKKKHQKNKNFTSLRKFLIFMSSN